MNKKHVVYFTFSLLVGLLTACGSDNPPVGDADPDTNPSLIVSLTAPDYLISGSTYPLSAQVPEGTDLVEGRWQRRAESGEYYSLSNQSENVHLNESFSPQKTYQTHNEVARLRFTAQDASGQTASLDLELPIYEQPLHVGQALTLKQGSQVRLAMALDDAFQQAVSGEFDTLLWTQVEGPEVALQDPATSVASFTAPDVNEVTRLRFMAQARASATDIGFDAEKVIYIVPEADWVDVVAIHNSSQLRAVLRADGSLLLYGVERAPHTRVLHLDIATDAIRDINGSITAVFALFEDGTARTLYMRNVNDRDDPDPLEGVTDIQAIGGFRYLDARTRSFYLLSDGNLYGIEGGTTHHGENIAGILPNFAGIQFKTSGEIVDLNGDVLVEQVHKASGASNRIAYILQDGTIGHTDLIFPEDHFPNNADYADIEFSSTWCDQLFVTRVDGGVEALTPNAHPLSPDVVDVKTLRAGCGANMALKQDGTALMWSGVYHDQVDPIVAGDEPAPWNLKVHD